MTTTIHKTLAAGRWFNLTLFEQLGNVGSEVGRCAIRVKAGKKKEAERALDRAFELLDLTISDPRWRHRLKEITRVREVLADTFYGDKVYNTNLEDVEKYFFQYALAARKDR